MLYGVHLSAQGAKLQSLRQDVIANNMANANTTSFKPDFLRAQAHQPFDKAQGNGARMPRHLEEMTGGVAPADIGTLFRSGPISQTNSPLDIALLGKGFLKIASGNEELLTRDGRLAIDNRGQLVTRLGGHPVLGPTGTAIGGLDPTLPTTFQADGTIAQRGLPVARLGLFAPDDLAALEKQGDNAYAGIATEAATGVQIQQGALEESAVDPVTEMVELIQASRAYEANINMIKYQDESLGRLIGSVGQRG